MFVPFSRIMAVLMAAVLCFGLLLPQALQRHNTVLATAVVGIFLVYLIANAVLWRRYTLKR